MNQYGYALGNPANGTDRTGLKRDCFTYMKYAPPSWAGYESGQGQTNGGGSLGGVPQFSSMVAVTEVQVCYDTSDPPAHQPGDGSNHQGHGEGYGQEGQGQGGGQNRGGSQNGGSGDGDGGAGDGDGNGDGDDDEGDGVVEERPSPVNWWAEYFTAALRAAFWEEWQMGECGRVFFEATRDALLPFAPSAASLGEPLALAWGAHQYSATLQYAASRSNYLGGRGLIYPMKSSVVRAGLQAAKLTAASGPLLQANFAIGQGLTVEMYALANGQCR